MKQAEAKNFEHKIFEVGLVLKLINGTLEAFGGLLFLLVKPTSWHKLALQLTQHELIGDPKDLVANYLRNVSAQLTIKGVHFTSIFLLSHGVIKVALIYGLLRKVLWVYPLSIGVFSGFIVYQMYRFSIGHSPWLLAISVLDLFIVIFTFLEYNNLKANNKRSKHVS